MNNFWYKHISKSIIFKVISTFEPNVFKLDIKTISSIQVLLPFLIIGVKIFSNFQKEWCTFDRKKRCLKKKELSIIKV